MDIEYFCGKCHRKSVSFKSHLPGQGLKPESLGGRGVSIRLVVLPADGDEALTMGVNYGWE